MRTTWAQSLSEQSKLYIAALPPVCFLVFVVIFRLMNDARARKSAEEAGLLASPSDDPLENKIAALEAELTSPYKASGKDYGSTGQVAVPLVAIEGEEGGISDELAYGTDEFRAQQEIARKEAEKGGSTAKTCDTGSVQGDYSAPWTTTFDMVFLICMIFMGL